MVSIQSLSSKKSLLTAWTQLKKIPGGGKLMGTLVGTIAPYSGTIAPEIVTLEPGFCQVKMKDRRAVRNHLKSVHAIALMNLGEVATGLAMMVSVPENSRSIITNLSMEYLKKARGTLTAECKVEVLVGTEKATYEVLGQITDSSGTVVARAHAQWLVSPAKAP